MIIRINPAWLLVLLLPLVDVGPASAKPLGLLCSASGEDDWANFIVILDPDAAAKGVMSVKGAGLDRQQMSDVGLGQIVGDGGATGNGRAQVDAGFFHVEADVTIGAKRQRWAAWFNRATDEVRLYYNQSAARFVALNGRCDRVSPAEFR